MVPLYSSRISRVPLYSISPARPFRVLGCHRLWRAFPDASTRWHAGLRAVPGSLAATTGISVDFFSSGYLDVSVPRVRLRTLYIQVRILRKRSGFPHSEIPGSKLVCQLSGAYRRLPRPSSPSVAKASAVCAYSLDHITSSSLTAAQGRDRLRLSAFLFDTVPDCQKTTAGYAHGLVEPGRIELPTSCMQSRRSPI